MATNLAERRLTPYEEYEALPPYQVGMIVRGTLHVFPRPAMRHANAASEITSALRRPFQHGRGGPGGWWIVFEPELHLVPKEPVNPDVAGWLVERMPDFPSAAHVTLPPDWVCEVLSRSTEKLDREEKMPLYAAHGVPHAWLVDPVAKTLEVYTLTPSRAWGPAEVYSGDALVRAPPFEALELELGDLWAKPARGQRF